MSSTFATSASCKAAVAATAAARAVGVSGWVAVTGAVELSSWAVAAVAVMHAGGMQLAEKQRGGKCSARAGEAMRPQSAARSETAN